MMRGDEVIGVRFLEAGFKCFITLDRHERFAPSIGILNGEQRCLVDEKRSMEEIEKVATFGPEKNRNDHQAAQAGEQAIPADASNFFFKESVSHETASRAHLADASMISIQSTDLSGGALWNESTRINFSQNELTCGKYYVR